MNLKMGILVVVMAAGAAVGQNAKPSAASTAPAVKSAPVAVKVAPSQPTTVKATKPAAVKPAATPAPDAAKQAAAKAAAKPGTQTAAAPQVKATPMGKVAGAQKDSGKKEAAKAEGTVTKNPDAVGDKKYAMTGKRDPFISPVVSHVGGSGCSTGKKCLEIGQIALKGVVRAESGFIAVVTNTLNKAYFLRENDPVFNGYVVKITGDSIVFKETYQDRLGKNFTREVVKKITTPAV